MSEGVRTWPEGKSFWKNTTKDELAKYIDGCLSECGITTETELYSFVLTQESREMYDAVVSELTKSKMFVDIIAGYRDMIDGNEGQPRTGKTLFDGVPIGKKPLAPSSDDKMADIDGTMKMGIVPNGSPITTSKDKYCRFCGTGSKKNAKFCTECGA